MALPAFYLCLDIHHERNASVRELLVASLTLCLRLRRPRPLLPPLPHLRSPRSLQIRIPKWQRTSALRAHTQPRSHDERRRRRHRHRHGFTSRPRLRPYIFRGVSAHLDSRGEVDLDVLGVMGVLVFAFFTSVHNTVAELRAAGAAVGKAVRKVVRIPRREDTTVGGNGIGALPESEGGFNVTDVKDTSTTYSKLDFDEFSPSSFATTAYPYVFAFRHTLPS
ncbi:hypothetical protein C8R45DRAFT_1079908 [Mycena sanguinolenta]|nr:hypothetical protein C8R45DRAFT_1079908 [Mycena sanguinolenta]